MERGIGSVLTEEMQQQASMLREALEDVEAAQANLLDQIREARSKGMPLRAISHNVGVNHERVRRAVAGHLTVKPF